MEYVRSWKVGDKTFTNKAEAQRYEAETALQRFGSIDNMIANADELIDLLKPFATPKRRKSANGQTDVPAPARAPARKGASAEASA